jgi:mRNA interferase MazF
MSRDAINKSSPVVIVVPVTNRAHKLKIYPSHVILRAGDGGLDIESVALGEQVRAISTKRLLKQLGHLAPHNVTAIAAALKIALDLP